MAIIRISHLNPGEFDGISNESSYLNDITFSELNSTRGGIFWLTVVGAAWLGYQIGQEAKTNWFKR